MRQIYIKCVKITDNVCTSNLRFLLNFPLYGGAKVNCQTALTLSGSFCVTHAKKKK